jgi:hypothetical protein
MIDTKKVKDRRQLRFDSVDKAIHDAQLVADAEARGTLRSTGNWTLGQALGHVAFWARAPYDGYPPAPRMPLLLRAIIPLFKKRFLNQSLPAGAHIRGVPGGTCGIDPSESDRGLAELRTAFERLAQRAPTIPNPVFGPLSHEDWVKLNLRHAELHHSFFPSGVSWPRTTSSGMVIFPWATAECVSNSMP